MGLYRSRILPWAMEKILARPVFQEQRREALRRARGRVLEVGFGFGASVGEYPPEAERIAELVALEPNPGMTRRARRRARAPAFPVTMVRGSAEAMPFSDASFDTVVTNWTLCSLADLTAGLAEIRRVLRRSGLYLFLEHGRAAEPALARRQEFLTPLQRILADGCRLDVAIDHEVRAAGLRIESLERYEMPWGPRALRPMYRGAARPS
ncbi:MAG: class I SAM-dependent methyltransferase [Acidobacteriota bacterium]